MAACVNELAIPQKSLFYRRMNTPLYQQNFMAFNYIACPTDRAWGLVEQKELSKSMAGHMCRLGKGGAASWNKRGVRV